jgi:Fur family ferric uptake transcriptional regulator
MPKVTKKTAADDILDRLREDGGRRTASRQAIIEVLLEVDGHITAEEIAERVQQRFPSVNKSTVYRTLSALHDSGVIAHVHFGHGSATYHFTAEDHVHLFCETCEEVQEVPASKLGEFTSAIERAYGFRVDHRHFAIMGRCGRCST